MIKKLLSVFLFLCSIIVTYANTGIYQSYVILQNGSLQYYDAQATTANADFENADLGSFSAGTSFLLQGGQIKTWKDGGSDITGGTLFYRIYKNGEAGGTFTSVNLSWLADNVDGSSNNQSWENQSAGINILNGLSAGDYVLEIYFSAQTSDGERFSNNDGNNYKAFFSVINEAVLNGIVTVSPPRPTRTEPVTIKLDASGTPLEGTSKIYFHSGLGQDSPDSYNFSTSIGNWGSDDGVGEMQNIGTNIWQITLSSIDEYYALQENDDAFSLNFLFRNADGSLKEDNNGSNYHLNINPGFYFLLQNPSYSPFLVQSGTLFDITAISDDAADWILYEISNEGLEISTIHSQSAVTSYVFPHSVTDSAIHYYKVKAIFNGESKEKIFQVKGYSAPITETMPSGAKQGANYNFPGQNEVTFVLHTPTSTTYDFTDCGGGSFSSTTAAKSIIYLIGDFNNWEISENYKLKKDGDYWWITLNPSADFSLPLKNEYVYQYLIDGNIRIGDPYGHKVSDPDDQYISSSLYPDLIAYPATKTSGRATVLELNKAEYQWEVPNFSRTVDRNNLNVYELHFRDFTAEGTYKAATEKLDYLKNMGINSIHVMPVSEFEGNNSWGYNPNYYFALDKAYGTSEDLKKFIDEAHKRGIAVFNDMVLNHAFYSNPNVMMYWDSVNNRPATDNPWFNAEHKGVYDSAGHWGADWNHSSNHTKAIMDDILDYWITEYKFDGFRFDFTKGFTQSDPNPSDPWASNYDYCRVKILERIITQMWTKHSGTYAIFEHLANDAEDSELANFGILMWSGAGPQEDWIKMAEGNEKRSFSSSLYSTRGFSYANYMSYMESHDEERVGYQVKEYGSNNDGSTQYLSNRLKLVAAFNLFLPGPRMVWEFGELGYDISINQNGRTGNKPSAWELGYHTDSERNEIYNLYAHIFKLRNTYHLYDNFDFRNNGSNADWNRTMSLYDNTGIQVIPVGNFDTANDGGVTPGYFTTGTWFKYNGDPKIDGTPYAVTSTTEQFILYKDDPVYILTNVDIVPPVFNVQDRIILTDYCQYQIPDASYDIVKGIWHEGTTQEGKVADNSGNLELLLKQINGENTVLNTLQGWNPKTGENIILWQATDSFGNMTEFTQKIIVQRGRCHAPGVTEGIATSTDVLISTLSRDKGNTTKRNGILTLESKTKGLVITKIPLNETVENYIPSPVKGMLVFDENEKCLKMYNGINWSCLKQKALPYQP